MRWPSDRALPAILRLLLAAAVFGSAALVFQDALVGAVVPVFATWIGWIDDAYRTVDLRAAMVGGELLVTRTATPAVVHVLGGHIVAVDPHIVLSTSVSAGIVLQPLVLAGALLFAWPWRRTGELPVRYVLALPLVALVILLDVPMMLYGNLWYQEVAALEPDRFSLLVTWPDLMNAGGRFALTLAAVALAVQAAARLTRPAPAPLAPPATAPQGVPPSRPAGHAA